MIELNITGSGDTHKWPSDYKTPIWSTRNPFTKSKGYLCIGTAIKTSTSHLKISFKPQPDKNLEDEPAKLKRCIDFYSKSCLATPRALEPKDHCFIKFMSKHAVNYMAKKLSDPNIKKEYEAHSGSLAKYSNTEAFERMASLAVLKASTYPKNALKFKGILYKSKILDRKTVILGLEEVLVHMSLRKTKDKNLVIEPKRQYPPLGKVDFTANILVDLCKV